MNPASSLAHALMSRMLRNPLLYWTTTFLGTSIIAFAFRKHFRRASLDERWLTIGGITKAFHIRQNRYEITIALLTFLNQTIQFKQDMSSTNNKWSCQSLLHIRSGQTFYYRTVLKQCWMIAKLNDETGIKRNAEHIEYTAIKFLPFCDEEIS